jgi:hypothetical protein
MFFSVNCFAQLADRFNFFYQHLGDSNSLSTSGFGGELNHISFFGDKDLLTMGIAYSDTRLSDRSAQGSDRTRQLRTFVPNLSLLRSLDSSHNLIVFLRPGIYGEGTGNIQDQFRVEGGFVINKAYSSKLTLGLGIARGSNFGRDLVVPLVQFLYQPDSQIYITGLLPVRAGAWYIHSSKIHFGGIFRLEGSVYNLEDTEISQASQLGFAAAQIGGAVKYNLFENSFIVGELGITALRRYEWQKNQGTTFDIGREPLLENELDRVPYIRFAWQQSF